MFMLAFEPLPTVYSVPKVQAHASAFSWPLEKNQAFRSGSVAVSSSSWAITLIMPSTPGLLFGLVLCAAQEVMQRAALPTKEYLMSFEKSVVCVCQPQYWVQKPEVSLTSC